MIPGLIYASLLCLIAGLGLLIYSEHIDNIHKSLFCFYVGIGLGFISAILLLIVVLSV